ncbi:putative transposase/invertase (TIGR01784 family) [Pedobacter africanus]|uniref:Transposase/invertase (TIGR01784 family) n=1 Tax=Pedobacter africanus TaxID=151894 RepID=A0ACC6KXB6_9SPHI|nr:Rpn family recombination-promoting nuclease/putative transposase [Pedobacter africanus]MDR6783787.1 putative transposase/invertase (TIGR01784 family) [Pedobacter africanus]
MPQKHFRKNILAEPVPTYGYNQQKRDPYFIDPLSDPGFKRLFGAEQSKALAITFLNHVLQGKRQVTSLEFLKNEYPGETKEEGAAVIDMVCKDQNGAYFIVEMQRNRHRNFKERSLFYASRLITEQAPHGNRKEWGYALKDVYIIAVLENFTVQSDNTAQWLHDVALVNTATAKIFSERLHFTYIELPFFNKKEDQLENGLENWVYALKNLKRLKQIPTVFTEPDLIQFCQAARYINLTKEEKNMISAKTKARWDYYAAIGGAKDEGEEIGEARGEARGIYKKAVEMASRLKAEGFNIDKIAEYTGLSVNEVEDL